MGSYVSNTNASEDIKTQQKQPFAVDNLDQDLDESVGEYKYQPELIIFGYLRRFQPELQSNIPNEIGDLCLAFYTLIVDRFIKCDSVLTKILSSDMAGGKVYDIARIKKVNHGIWGYVCGNIMINPSENENAVITWTIENGINYSIFGVNCNYLDLKHLGMIGCGWYGYKVSNKISNSQIYLITCVSETHQLNL